MKDCPSLNSRQKRGKAEVFNRALQRCLALSVRGNCPSSISSSRFPILFSIMRLLGGILSGRKKSIAPTVSQDGSRECEIPRNDKENPNPSRSK